MISIITKPYCNCFFIYLLFRSWDQCESGQDYLSVRDGKSLEAPELARLCGGDVLPDVTSSGPDMLVQFKTTGHDTPFHPNPVAFLPGFELQVHVRMTVFNPCKLLYDHL